MVFYLIVRFESQNLLIDNLSYTLKLSYPFLCLITSNDSFFIPLLVVPKYDCSLVGNTNTMVLCVLCG